MREAWIEVIEDEHRQIQAEIAAELNRRDHDRERLEKLRAAARDLQEHLERYGRRW